MKRTTGLLLATGLAILVAGCAQQGGAGGSGATAPSGNTVASAGGSASSAGRDFDTKVRCPGVHELKSHGWSDAQIMAQLNVTQDQIPACEAWAQAQPKGYVPPPPPGVTPRAPGAGAAPKAAASPSAAH